MQETGKLVMIVGLAIAAIGALMWLGVSRWLRLGRLPGDIAVERPGVSFYFPVTTMILVSALIMLVSWVVAYFRR